MIRLQKWTAMAFSNFSVSAVKIYAEDSVQLVALGVKFKSKHSPFFLLHAKPKVLY